jgi:hypothetical protein
MIDAVREELLGHLLGALEDSEQELIENRLKGEPDLLRELAEVRRQLLPLLAIEAEAVPPPGLAKRTCQFVFSHPATSRAPQRRTMSATAAVSGWIGGLRWIDITVAVALFVVAALLLFPAIQGSRFRAQVAACQDNLRYLGMALTQYSERHDQYFPRIPTHGRLAAAGIYAPTLLGEECLTEASRVVCPTSALADGEEFHLPSLDEVEQAPREEIEHLRRCMGGSYGYVLGHVVDGVYHDTKNLRRATFALMADAPSPTAPDHRSLNHGGQGQNVLFEDGHVLYLTCSRLCESGDDFFTNDDGQIDAGTSLNDAVIVPSPTPPIHCVDFP